MMQNGSLSILISAITISAALSAWLCPEGIKSLPPGLVFYTLCRAEEK